MPRPCAPCLWRERGLCGTPPGAPCPVHCQCSACGSCPRPPSGHCQRGDAAKSAWRATCIACTKYCKSTRGNYTAVAATPQDHEVRTPWHRAAIERCPVYKHCDFMTIGLPLYVCFWVPDH